MSEFDNESEENKGKYNLLEILLRDFLPYWPVIIAAAIIGFFSSVAYLKYQRPIHQSEAGILLNNENENSTESLLKQAVGKPETRIEDELEILRGSNVMKGAASLSNSLFSIRRTGKFVDYVYYKNAMPFEVQFLNEDSIITYTFPFYLNTEGNIVANGNQVFPYNQQLIIGGNKLIFKKIPGNEKWAKGLVNVKNATIHFYSLEDAGDIIKSSFSIEQNKKSSTIILRFIADKPERTKQCLRAIIQSYQKETQNEKRKRALFTMNFIDDRLAYVGEDLDSVESDLENFKKQNDIERISGEALLYLDKVKSGDQLAAQTDLQLMVLSEIEKYVEGRIKKPGMVPSLIGLSDANLTSYFEKLNEAEINYDQLLNKNGRENDAVKSLEKQIKTYKDAVSEIIINTRRNLNLLKRKAEDDFVKNNGKYDNMMRSIPSKQRKLFNITRQQNIKNALYTFLLEKREESAIQQAGILSDVRIVQSPTYMGIISPMKTNVRIQFTLGSILIVLIVLVIKKIGNNKISSTLDIKNRTKVPVIAGIMLAETDSPLVMMGGSRSLITEQIRGLRTNLSHFLDSNGKSKLLVSSSIPGEGKSFLSSNIALAYAMAGKRTILIESDLRKPNIAKHFDIKNRAGLSSYLSGNYVKDDLIVPTEFENLFIIPSGPIPPDPVELIMNGRYQSLIEELGNEYDHIVIDCPPIGLVTDAQVIGHWVDAAIFVVRHNYTPKVALEELVEKLREDKKFKQMAIVFNGIKGGISGYGYGYGGYGYGYGGYGYGYGGYGYGGYGYGGYGSSDGYYGSKKKKSLDVFSLAFDILIAPFLVFFGRKKQ